jgi:hypothetical protein
MDILGLVYFFDIGKNGGKIGVKLKYFFDIKVAQNGQLFC